MPPQRILIYSHDTYGLGHLRRCLRIAETLAASPEPPCVLIATGSPRAQAFDLPAGCDTLKLPALTKDSDGGYRARTMSVSLSEIVHVRAELLLAAARAFRPHLLLVDHAPAGAAGELWPLLRELSELTPRPRLVLGLRDVIDDAEAVRAEWGRLGAWDALHAVYDRVLVYGDPSVLTTAHELGLPERLPGKVAFVGYLGAPGTPARAPGPSPHAPRPGLPRILVTAGGGGDGQDLLRGYADFLHGLGRPAPFQSTVVTGPFLSERRDREVAARLRASGQPVRLVRFSGHMESLLRRAAGVVCMAGYNTVVEVMSAGVPALLSPRSEPRLEQSLRATRLAPVTGLEVCTPASLPASISSFVSRAVAREIHCRPRVRLDGLAHVREELLRAGEEPFIEIRPAERRARAVVA